MNPSPQDGLPSDDFKKELPQFNNLISEWRTEEDLCRNRRTLRQNKRSTEEERQKGTIPKDGTIIPDRTIASNIRRSKVAYTNYISRSQRILLVTDPFKPQISIEPLETWFTRGMRYPGWKSPWNKLVDSMLLHGGSPVEIVYDAANPLNCGIEYIERAELLFPLKSRYLQAAPRILRRYVVTITQLEEFAAKYRFNETVVKDVFIKFSNQSTFVTIYRALTKIQGIVHNSWFTTEATNDWLRAPEPHDIGLISFDPNIVTQMVPGPDGQPVPLFMEPNQWAELSKKLFKPQPLAAYPIFWFNLQDTETEELLDEQGRASMDLHVQEAMMRLLTNTVNATTRASGSYPCTENEPGGDPELKELGPIKPDVIMSRKLIFNQFPWPNNIILAVMQALKIGKADESGQTDFAATARKDANKTARELELATDQANLVVGADLDIFSTPFLEVYGTCFNIACHQALFNLCPRPIHPELLIGDYVLQSAADVEVLKRAEDKENAKEFFNIVKGTPAAEKILTFLIKRFFPDTADEWIESLSQPDLRGLVAQMLSILESIPINELNIAPEQKLAFGNIIATARQLVGAPSDQPVPGPAGSPPAETPPPSNEPAEAASQQ